MTSAPDPAAGAYSFRVLFSWRFASARLASGLTQAAVATRLRVSRALVSAWEQGAALPPVHQAADVARALGVDLAVLLASPAAGTHDERDGADMALLRGAVDEFAVAERDGREPSPPGVVVQRVLHARTAPARGRPARRPGATPPPARPPDAAAEPKPSAPAAEPHAAQPRAHSPVPRTVQSPFIRDRVRAALSGDGSPESRWAARDLTRYWRLLDDLRSPVRAQAPLPADAARVLGPALNGLDREPPAEVTDPVGLLRRWASSKALPEAARSYFIRVLQLGGPAALVCADAVAQVQAADLTAEERTGMLLRLLGTDDAD